MWSPKAQHCFQTMAENGATRAQYMIYRYIHQKDSLRDDFPSLQCVLLLHLVTRQGYISKQHRQSELKETLGNVLALIPWFYDAPFYILHFEIIIACLV